MQSLVLGLLCLFAVQLTAQNFTISGIVSDSTSGETLINASVWVDGSTKGCVSNVYGFYSLQLPKGQYTLKYSYVGFQAKTVNLNLNQNIAFNQLLLPQGQIDEIKVSARRGNELFTSRMSTISVNLEQTHKSPTIMGEPDVFKVMQMSPGVEGGLEGSSGLYVRGGDNGQNLILIDGIPVYNVSHLMGYISVFNPEAIRNSELLKGGIPARYGGRASSVVDVRMKEGNANKLSGAINVSTLMAGGLIEGPIGEKTSFMVAGRRTILDPFYSSFNNAQTSYDMLYSCWDINAKINHKFNDKNRLYGSFFTGFDHARSKADKRNYSRTSSRMLPNGEFVTDSIKVTKDANEAHKWGNVLGAARWNHIFGNKLFLNTSFTYTNYFNRNSEQEKTLEHNNTNGQNYTSGYIFSSTSDIQDLSVLLDFDWFASSMHNLKFGVQGIYHNYRPTAQFDSITSTSQMQGIQVKPAKEMAFYVEDIFKWKKLELNLGIRVSGFGIEDTTFMSIEPRVSLCYNINNYLSFKASYMQASQNVHLVSSSTVGFSTDYWVPASKQLQPEATEQMAGGFILNLEKDISIQIEGYYKKMQNVIEFRDDRVFTMEDKDWEWFLSSGKGHSYGIETSVAKNSGKLTGWVSYTWSRSWREFASLNHGEKYPFKYDRPHNLTIVAMYKPNQKIDYGANWMLASGYNYTFNKEQIGWDTYYYGKNNMRYPMYHRLDVGVNLHKQKKHGKRTWRFGAYNAYNQMNASYYRIDEVENYSSFDDSNGARIKVTKVTLFPIIPYISYRYAFGDY